MLLESYQVTFNHFYGLKNFNAREERVQKDGTKGMVHLEIKRRQVR